MKKTGILGGTFNPVHLEHIQLAKSAVKELDLDKLIVMPTFISPHKDSTPADAVDRLNMLKLAFKDEDKIEVSDYEILKGGKSYTYQTVEHFKETIGGEIFFITGGDMLTDFKNWRFPERILKVANLAVFDRDDFYTDYGWEKSYFKEKFNKEFIKLGYKGKNASSTKIRIYSKFGLSLDGLTTVDVENYIKEKGLYKGNFYNDYVREHLTEKRLIHTANVVVTALQKAKSLGLDPEKVELATTLHDVAKYMDYRDFPDFHLPEGVPQPVIHAFLGAYVAENILKVDDPDIVDAIMYHTSAKPNMTTLAKLVFVADMVEENRDYDGVVYLRELYEKSDFEFCFRECLAEEMLHLKNKGTDIYAKTMDAYEYYKDYKKEV